MNELVVAENNVDLDNVDLDDALKQFKQAIRETQQPYWDASLLYGLKTKLGNQVATVLFEAMQIIESEMDGCNPYPQHLYYIGHSKYKTMHDICHPNCSEKTCAIWNEKVRAAGIRNNLERTSKLI